MEISLVVAEPTMVSAQSDADENYFGDRRKSKPDIGDSMRRWRGNNPRCRLFQLAAFLILFLQAFAGFYVLWNKFSSNTMEQRTVLILRFIAVI